MLVVNAELLARFSRRNRDAGKWLDRWLEIVGQSAWTNVRDVRRTYPSADGVKVRSGLIVTVFNVKGNEYRLLTFIDYSVQRVAVIDILSHAEYSKKHPDWRDRL